MRGITNCAIVAEMAMSGAAQALDRRSSVPCFATVTSLTIAHSFYVSRNWRKPRAVPARRRWGSTGEREMPFLPFAWAASDGYAPIAVLPRLSALSAAPAFQRCLLPGTQIDWSFFMFAKDHTLAKVDPELWGAIQKENQRQQDHIELIASENYTSPAVMQAQGSQLTNKYAEGYPGKRYYGGCEFVDMVEQLAIDRIKQLFGAEHANVQPNSGSQANQGVFFAMLKPGDTIMGMSLAEGGHLTHGMALNMSGKWFNVVSYGLTEQEDIDYEQMERLAREHKPRLIIAGASAFALRIDFERFARVAKEVGAWFMVDMAHYAGLIAAGEYPNPVPYADFVTSTTHKSLRGPRGGIILMKAEHEKAINSAIFPGIQGGPLMHVIAGKAVAFQEALSPEFK